MSMQLARVKHGCSEKIHQHPLYPLKDFPFPLSRCEHCLWWCFCCPIPTGPSLSTQATPFFWGQGGLASWTGEVGLKVYPNSQEVLWESSEEEHYLSELIPLLIPLLALHPCQEEGTQTEGGLAFHPALKLLQDCNQARAQLECELVQETQELAQRYNNKWIKQARRHERWWAQMIEQTDATFQEAFSQASSADSIKLLPWCISMAVPLCYMSGTMATAMQQDEDISAASEPEGSLTPGPSSSPVHPTQNSTTSSTSLTRYPLCRHCPTGVPICWVPCNLHTEKVRLFFQQFTQQSSQQEDPCWLRRGWS